MIRVNKLDFKEALDFVKCAVSKDKYRPFLTGIHLQVKGSRLIVEAVDGYRVMQASVEILESDTENFDCIFNYNMSIKATKKDFDNNMDIEITNDKTVIFEDISAHQSISYCLIKGEYFNTDNIWPECEPEYQVRLNPKFLAELAKAYKDKGSVLLSFYGELKPVIASIDNKPTDNGRGMLLPLRK